jgi:hypothetical protein
MARSLAPLHQLSAAWQLKAPFTHGRFGLPSITLLPSTPQTAEASITTNNTTTRPPQTVSLVSKATTFKLGNSRITQTHASGQPHPTQKGLWHWQLEADGDVSELELNKLLGNNLFYQPTRYPIEARLHLRSSGSLHPQHPLTRSATLTTAHAELQTSDASHQPIGRLELPLLKPWNQALRLHNGRLLLLQHPEPILISASLDEPAAPQWLWSRQGHIRTVAPLPLSKLGTGVWNATLQQPAQPWFETGTGDLDIHWNQAFKPPHITANLKDASSSTLGLQKLEASLKSNGTPHTPPTELTLTVPTLELAGSKVSITSQAALPQALPLSFSPVFVNGERVYVDGLQQWLTQQSTPIVQAYQAGLPPALTWLPSKQVNLPFELHNGVLNLEQVIFQNMLLTNYIGGLELFSHQFLELAPFSCDVAGGNLHANLWLSPQQNNRITLDMDAYKVKVNALATTLLNSPNQIFGDLTGQIRVSTWGDTQEEQIKHTNGEAHFKISEGRIPALSTVERLLTVSNVWRGGVFGLNIGNLYASLSPTSQLVYKATMWGDANFLDGSLFTKSTLADGQNLDLWLNGQMSLITGKSDMTITGAVKQNMATILPNWSQWNLRQGLRYVPIPYVGGSHWPLAMTRKPSLFDYIPGVGFLPGLGGIPQDRNFFSIDAKGALENPSTYRNLRWLPHSDNEILNQLP